MRIKYDSSFQVHSRRSSVFTNQILDKLKKLSQCNRMALIINTGDLALIADTISKLETLSRTLENTEVKIL